MPLVSLFIRLPRTNPINIVVCTVDADNDNNTATNVPRMRHSSQSEAVYSDASGALFSIYLQTADEEDKKMTESWKGDADGILVFVCRENSFPFLAFSRLSSYRLGYFPLQSLDSSDYLIRTFDKTLKTLQPFILRIYTKSLPPAAQPTLFFLFPRTSLIHPHSHHPHLQSGSMSSGL